MPRQETAKRDAGFAERFGMKRPLTVTEMVVALFCSTMIVLTAQQLLQPSLGGGHTWTGYSDDRFESVKNIELPYQAGTGIRLFSENGSVKVERGGTDTITVVATFRSPDEERATDAAAQASIDDGMLTFRPEWPGGKRLNKESVELRITMPGITSADIETDNGRIDLTGAAGDARLISDNGRITLTDHDGDATLQSDNGRITATDVTGTVIAESDNGRLTFENVGGRVSAESDNGRITLVQSENSNAPFELQTDNGRVTVELSESFSGYVAARSGNGRVQLGQYSASDMKGMRGYKENRMVARLDRGQMTVMPTMPERVGDAAVSTIRSGNGRITVSARGVQDAQMSTTPGA